MTMANTKQWLAELPVASTALRSDPVFVHPGGTALLTFEFERKGVVYRGGLHFQKVRAYRFTSEGHVTPWHIEGTYDTLVEVPGSGWVAELLAAEPTDSWGRWEIRHYMIYIDSAGCFEVAASGWTWMNEERLP